MAKGESEAGVTVFQVDTGIDTGPIIVQKKYNLENLSLDEALLKSKKLAVDCLIEALDKLIDGEVQYLQNSNEYASYNSFPTREDVIQFKSLGRKFY